MRGAFAIRILTRRVIGYSTFLIWLDEGPVIGLRKVTFRIVWLWFMNCGGEAVYFAAITVIFGELSRLYNKIGLFTLRLFHLSDIVTRSCRSDSGPSVMEGILVAKVGMCGRGIATFPEKRIEDSCRRRASTLRAKVGMNLYSMEA